MNGRQQLVEQIRQQSIQKRAQALREAARNQANNVPIAGAVGGGGGRRVPSGCLPPGGLMLTFDLIDFEGTFRIFLAEDGVENDRPVYISQVTGKEGTEIFSIGFRARWNGNLWELIQFEEGREEPYSEIAATSPELYADEWNIVSDIIPFSSSPGEEFLCEWRYCATITEEGYTGINTLLPAWFEIPLTEFPNGFFFLGKGVQAFWSPEDQSWVSEGNEGFVLLGGTRESLPLGTFQIGDGKTLTISAGVCSISPSEL
jgi:hypothetical protein